MKLDYTGLKGWKTRAVWQACVALVLLALNPSALRWWYVPVIIGFTGGFIQAWLLRRMEPKRIPAVTWICMGTLVLLSGLISYEGHSAGVRWLGWAGLGFVCIAVLETVFSLRVPGVIRSLEATPRVNSLVRYHEYQELQKEPVPDIGLQGALEQLSTILPPRLAEEFRSSVTDVIIMKAAGEAGGGQESPSSSIGGVPLLPAGVEWPSHEGSPLDYLARINLADLPPVDEDRPATGIVSFFYDIERQPWGSGEEDHHFHRLVFDPDPEKLAPVESSAGARHQADFQPVGFEKIRGFCGISETMDKYQDFYRSADYEIKRKLVHLPDILGESVPFGHRVLSPPGLV